MTCCSVTKVSPLLYGLWLSLISSDFSLIFMMCCSVATIFIQPALPSPFALLPFLPHTGELGLKTIKILERQFFTLLTKPYFIGIDLRQIFRTSNTPHPTQFWHFFFTISRLCYIALFKTERQLYFLS